MATPGPYDNTARVLIMTWVRISVALESWHKITANEIK